MAAKPAVDRDTGHAGALAGDPPYDLVVRAGQAVVDGRQRAATVGVRAGRIVAVGGADEDWSGTAELVLDADEVLLPGLVDTHVHVNEPGRTHWEGFATATQAAAAGGITTIVDMPLNSIPPTTSVDALAVKQDAAQGRCYVDVGFWGGAVPGNRPDLQGLHEAGVFGFKCFLADSGVEEFPPLDRSALREYLAEVARLGALMIVHAEDAGEIASAPPASGRHYVDFLRSRPRAAEEAAIAQVIDGARATGARAHVLHLSDADAVPTLRAARAEGVALTVETCPHYLAFASEEVPDGQTLFKCCPPIRESGNRDALWTALAAGDIDCVVSDHSPSEPSLKHLDTGDFGTAWGGISGLEVSLPAVWTEASARGHHLTDVVRWMAERPAALVGLTGKGAIEVGRDADFAVFAPSEGLTVYGERLHHRHPVSPYAGRTLRGVVRSTWLRGTKITGEARGRLLRRGQS